MGKKQIDDIELDDVAVWRNEYNALKKQYTSLKGANTRLAKWQSVLEEKLNITELEVAELKAAIESYNILPWYMRIFKKINI